MGNNTEIQDPDVVDSEEAVAGEGEGGGVDVAVQDEHADTAPEEEGLDPAAGDPGDRGEDPVDEGEDPEDDLPEDEVVEVPLATARDAGLPAHRELEEEESLYYRGLLEAVLFLASEPLNLNVLAKKINMDRSNTRGLVDDLADDYAERDGGILLREIAGGYQFITSDRYSDDLKSLFKETKRETLTRSTLETLAIIAYRQPITLPEIDEIRGAASRNLVTTLMTRKLVKSQGYRPVPGRPTLYVTSRQFLEHLALGSLSDLPVLEDIKELKFDDLD